jgi:hypothetical protein
MVMAIVAALAITVATLSIRNLQSARLSQQGGVAVNAADAGVAQAVSFLRVNGVADLCPAPTVYNPPAADFNRGFDLATQRCVTSLSASQRVPGQPYSVVIVTRAAYPTNGLGSYTVFSKGVGADRAARLVAADITVTGGGAPRGSSFFGHEIRGSGTVTVNQSIFSTGCVYNRGAIKMNEDPNARDAYGLPPAVHSSQFITNDGVNRLCSRSQLNSPIHAANVCAPNHPFDQDVLGGPLAATSACVTSRPPNVPAATWERYYPDSEGSRISSSEMLLSLFGIKDPALSQTDIDRLRAIAQSQGNYKTSTSSSDVVTPNGSQAVLFYDLTAGNVNLSNIRGFGHTAACPTRSLVVVVVGGGTTFPSGAPLVASVFVTTPGMIYAANGGVLVGSVYADKISLGGNAVVSEDAQTCADKNPSPALLDFNVTTYREIDG